MAKVFEVGNPSNFASCPLLPIGHSEVSSAYFAKATIKEVWEGAEEAYFVKAGDTLHQIASAHQTTTYDLRRINPEITKVNQDNIRIGQKIKLKSRIRKGSSIQFDRIKQAQIGDEIYVIVEVKDMSTGRKLYLNIRQGKESVLTDKNQALSVTFQGRETQLIEAEVNVLELDRHKKKYLNAEDYRGKAIAKLRLAPKDQSHLKQWEDALTNCGDPQTFLYLLVDAHTPVNIRPTDVIYKGYVGTADDNQVSNCFLNEEGTWFGLKHESQRKTNTGGKGYKWAHSEFANLIGKYESRNNYNLCNKTKGGLSVVRGLILRNYTLGEIQEKQKKRDLFAVGRYQIIPITMKGAVRSLNLQADIPFDENLQDRIFEDYLIRIKRPKIINYLEGNGSIEDAMYSTAQEWASVAVEAGKKISKGRIAKGGQSYYVGDGLNKAHISTQELKKALIDSKNNKGD